MIQLMSEDQAMIPSLSERLGKKGYTIVARAPQLTVPQLADGSWHVVGGSSPTQPDVMHEIEPELIPFIIQKGGDIVLYRLSDEGIGEAKPVLSRGGMAGRPPTLSSVISFDPNLVRRLSELRTGLDEEAEARKAPEARPFLDWRVLTGVAASLALVLGATAYLTLPAPAPGGATRWVPDMNNPRDVAIMKGATVIAMPSKGDPNTMVLYRNYPGESGKGGQDQVGTFKRGDLDRVQGNLPDSRIRWRPDF